MLDESLYKVSLVADDNGMLVGVYVGGTSYGTMPRADMFWKLDGTQPKPEEKYPNNSKQLHAHFTGYFTRAWYEVLE